MLNITRKVGEKIVIGENIILEVMEVSGSSVRVGIQAPRSVPVYREEIWEAVRAENAAAAKSTPTKLPQPPAAAAGEPPRRGIKTRPSGEGVHKSSSETFNTEAEKPIS